MIDVLFLLNPYSKGARKWLVLNLITAIIGNAFILINPLLIGMLIGELSSLNEDYTVVIKYLVVIGIFYILGSIILWFSQAFSHNFATLVTKNLRNQAFHVITNTRIAYIDQTQTGDVMARFSQDIDLVFDALSHFFMNVFQGGTTVLFSIILMIYLNIWLTLVVVMVVPVIFLYSKLTNKKRNERFMVLQKLTGNLTATAKEYFGEKKLIQSYNYEETAKRNFDSINNELTEVGEKAYFSASLNNPTYRVFNNVAFAMLGLVSLLLHKFGYGITPAVLTSMIMYAAMFSKPFNEYSVLTSSFMAGRAGVNRVLEIIQMNVESERIDFSFKDRAREGNIEFKNVSFGYTKDQELIKDFNLKVTKGQKVAIVGPTGAGKSTMINLLMRFYDIRSGEIIIDGKKIKEYNRKALRLSFGLVLQEPWLFGGTIFDNLTYGKKRATMEQVIEASKKANCHNFITNLKDGYDTVLDDKTNLSVGQRQLLTIARALIIDPPILILDEATSNIDSLMEHEIQKTFNEAMKGKTSFVIAHRLKTIIDSDIIIVMNQGDIVEYGRHEELMNKDNGFYKNLYLSQFTN